MPIIFSDHGHDHIGSDRGAEAHPFLGYNYRISELHAAVGLAQIERLDDFIAIQKQHYSVLRNTLSKIPEVTFRRVPEGGVESYAFLNFFLPTATLAKNVHTALTKGGVDACFYWYDNNWHYHKEWDHLKHLKSLGSLPKEVQEQLPNYETVDFSKSDHWMGRTISCLIKLSWDAESLEKRATDMTRIITEVIAKNT